jgi:hypothetical protein
MLVEVLLIVAGRNIQLYCCYGYFLHGHHYAQNGPRQSKMARQA